MVGATWQGEPERLDRVLASLGLTRSRSQAAELIAAGGVRVNGETAVKASLRVAHGSSLELSNQDHYVSRAAHKLIAGLDTFQVAPFGVLALDVGASTGGFTQVLLERGAQQVLAVDVGHNQLAASIRQDVRVRVVEGCNARDLTPLLLAQLTGQPEPPTLVVADLSFISLTLVLPALSAVASADAQFVLLIKPQFEVGRTGISAGIVTDTELAADAVLTVLEAARGLGMHCHGLIASPITGEHGNREVLVHFARDEPRNQTEWKQHIRQQLNHGGES